VPAVGGGKPSQKPTLTDWPTPAGLGATLMKAYVGICHGGVWALAVGTSIIEADIESIKKKAIAIAAVLPFNFCIFFLPFLFFGQRKKIENLLSKLPASSFCLLKLK
jgi:hypothetical protein